MRVVRNSTVQPGRSTLIKEIMDSYPRERRRPARTFTVLLASLVFSLIAAPPSRSGAAPQQNSFHAVVNARDFGAKGDGRTDDTIAIRRAESKAEAIGRVEIYYPPAPVFYLISKPIYIRHSGITEAGAGRRSAIHQSSWGLPVFEVRQSNNVTLKKLALISTRPRTVIPGWYDHAPARGRSAGVYVFGSSRVSARHLFVKGFAMGVSFNAAPRTLDSGNSVVNSEFRSVDQGVLAGGQQDLHLSNIRATTELSQAGNPTHAVYVITGDPALRQKGLRIDDVRCENCVGGSAVQMKEVSGAKVTNVTAMNSAGLLSLDYVNDSTFRHLVLAGGKALPETGIIHFIGRDISHNTFEDISIRGVKDAVGIGILGNSADNTFSNVDIHETLDPNTGAVPILVRGSRNHFQNTTVTISGADKPGIVFQQGLGHTLSGYRYQGRGNRRVVVEPGAEAQMR